MKAISVKKEKLLKILKENLTRHNRIFLDAMNGYRKKAIELLDASIEQAKSGGKINTYIRLDEPVDQSQDYERVIGMLQMAEDALVDLSEGDYARYVLDVWDWSDNFHSTNSSYTTYDRIPRITTID